MKEDKENEGNGENDDAKERGAARSSVSFSLEKEAAKPWPHSLSTLEKR